MAEEQQEPTADAIKQRRKREKETAKNTALGIEKFTGEFAGVFKPDLKRVIKMMDGKRVAQLSSMFDAPQCTAEYAERIRKLGRCRDVIIRAKIKLPQNDAKRKSATKLSWMDYSPESTAAA